MTAGLETFAKVRALHDRTDNPGEKAAAAGRMKALARAAILEHLLNTLPAGDMQDVRMRRIQELQGGGSRAALIAALMGYRGEQEATAPRRR